MKLVFCGTPDFAVPSLATLDSGVHDVVAVVTQPDRPKGRGRKPAPSPIKQYAQEHGLRVIQPEKASSPDSIGTLREIGPGLLVVVAYGERLKEEVLEVPAHGAINLHASLLPKYRGTSPIQAAILNGDHVTGVTVIQIDKGMDTGDVLGSAEVEIEKDYTAGTLHDRLADVGAKVLADTVDGIAAGTVIPRPQNHQEATCTRLLTKRDGVIDWNMPAEKLHSFVRAMNPWPLAHTEDGKYRLWKTSVSADTEKGASPGTVLSVDDAGFQVVAGEGAIRIERIQAAGGKPMSAVEFLRGHKLEPGDSLG